MGRSKLNKSEKTKNVEFYLEIPLYPFKKYNQTVCFMFCFFLRKSISRTLSSSISVSTPFFAKKSCSTARVT